MSLGSRPTSPHTSRIARRARRRVPSCAARAWRRPSARCGRRTPVRAARRPPSSSLRRPGRLPNSPVLPGRAALVAIGTQCLEREAGGEGDQRSAAHRRRTPQLVRHRPRQMWWTARASATGSAREKAPWSRPAAMTSSSGASWARTHRSTSRGELLRERGPLAPEQAGTRHEPAVVGQGQDDLDPCPNLVLGVEDRARRPLSGFGRPFRLGRRAGRGRARCVRGSGGRRPGWRGPPRRARHRPAAGLRVAGEQALGRRQEGFAFHLKTMFSHLPPKRKRRFHARPSPVGDRSSDDAVGAVPGQLLGREPDQPAPDLVVVLAEGGGAGRRLGRLSVEPGERRLLAQRAERRDRRR